MNVLIDDLERTEIGGQIPVLGGSKGESSGHALIKRGCVEFGGKDYKAIKDGPLTAVLVEVIKEGL